MVSPVRRVLRVAAVQMSSQEDVAGNLAECVLRVEEAARAGAELVVLPENFAHFGSDDGRLAAAERIGDLDSPIHAALSGVAGRVGVTVVAGGMPERSGDGERPYNTCVVFGPAGEVVASYRKIHLFDVDLPDGTSLRESRTTLPGTEAVVVPVQGLRVGLSICYDLRFPELYRALSDRGSDLLVVPAAFTRETGKDHWHVLLRARAIESQAYVIAAAQWGKHSRGRTTYGHSLVVDPWGTIIAEASDCSGLVLADVDPGYLGRVRAALPSLRHRRLRS